MTTSFSSRSCPRPRARLACAAAAMTVLWGGLAGCQSDAQTGALIGSGVGALIGQAAGGSSEATLLGAGIGAGVGYVAGNAGDRRQAQEDKQHAVQDARNPSPTPNAQSASADALANTRWRVSSLTMEPPYAYQDIVVDFAGDSTVTTRITRLDGVLKTERETYRLVSNSLFLIDRNQKTTHASYDLFNGRLYVVAPNFRATLEKLP